MECKAWVDECSAKCVEEKAEQCSDECKKILAEHELRCFEDCSAVPWEYGEVVVEEVPRHWVNCTHRNASYCQYRFLSPCDPCLVIVYFAAFLMSLKPGARMVLRRYNLY